MSEGDVSAIQDEDVLRRMWQQTDDFGRKKEIRAHMYRLREERLRSLYGSEGGGGEGDGPLAPPAPPADKGGRRAAHSDSFADQCFQSLKSKEIRDSESPTRDYNYSVQDADNANTGWTVVAKNEVSDDGNTVSEMTLAHKSGTKEIDGGNACFSAIKENAQSVTQHEDENSKIYCAESKAKSVAKEQFVSKTDDGMMTSSTTSSVGSSVTKSSFSQKYDSNPNFRSGDNDSPKPTRENLSSTDTTDNMATSHHSVNENIRNTSSSVTGRDTTMCTEGELISRKVQHPDEHTTVIIEKRSLPDGTIVTSTSRETTGSYITSGRQTGSHNITTGSDMTSSQRSVNKSSRHIESDNVSVSSRTSEKHHTSEYDSRDTVSDDVRNSKYNTDDTINRTLNIDDVVCEDVSTDNYSEKAESISKCSDHIVRSSKVIDDRTTNITERKYSDQVSDINKQFVEEVIQVDRKVLETEYPKPEGEVIEVVNNKKTTGEYLTTYQSDYTSKRVSQDLSPTHEAFARSLRSSPDSTLPGISPTRGSNRSLKTSTTSLRSVSPEKSSRSSSPRKQSDSSPIRRPSADRHTTITKTTHENRSTTDHRVVKKSDARDGSKVPPTNTRESSPGKSPDRKREPKPHGDTSPSRRGYDAPLNRTQQSPERKREPKPHGDTSPKRHGYDAPLDRTQSPDRKREPKPQGDTSPTRRGYDAPLNRTTSPDRKREPKPQGDTSPTRRGYDVPLNRTTSPDQKREQKPHGGKSPTRYGYDAPLDRTQSPDRKREPKPHGDTSPTRRGYDAPLDRTQSPDRKREPKPHEDTSPTRCGYDAPLDRTPSPDRKREPKLHGDTSPTRHSYDAPLDRTPSPDRKRDPKPHGDTSPTRHGYDAPLDRTPSPDKKREPKPHGDTSPTKHGYDAPLNRIQQSPDRKREPKSLGDTTSPTRHGYEAPLDRTQSPDKKREHKSHKDTSPTRRGYDAPLSRTQQSPDRKREPKSHGDTSPTRRGYDAPLNRTQQSPDRKREPKPHGDTSPTRHGYDAPLDRTPSNRSYSPSKYSTIERNTKESTTYGVKKDNTRTTSSPSVSPSRKNTPRHPSPSPTRSSPTCSPTRKPVGKSPTRNVSSTSPSRHSPSASPTREQPSLIPTQISSSREHSPTPKRPSTSPSRIPTRDSPPRGYSPPSYRNKSPSPTRRPPSEERPIKIHKSRDSSPTTSVSEIEFIISSTNRRLVTNIDQVENDSEDDIDFKKRPKTNNSSVTNSSTNIDSDTYKKETISSILKKSSFDKTAEISRKSSLKKSALYDDDEESPPKVFEVSPPDDSEINDLLKKDKSPERTTKTKPKAPFVRSETYEERCRKILGMPDKKTLVEGAEKNLSEILGNLPTDLYPAKSPSHSPYSSPERELTANIKSAEVRQPEYANTTYPRKSSLKKNSDSQYTNLVDAEFIQIDKSGKVISADSVENKEDITDTLLSTTVLEKKHDDSRRFIENEMHFEKDNRTTPTYERQSPPKEVSSPRRTSPEKYTTNRDGSLTTISTDQIKLKDSVRRNESPDKPKPKDTPRGISPEKIKPKDSICRSQSPDKSKPKDTPRSMSSDKIKPKDSYPRSSSPEKVKPSSGRSVSPNKMKSTPNISDTPEKVKPTQQRIASPERIKPKDSHHRSTSPDKLKPSQIPRDTSPEKLRPKYSETKKAPVKEDSTLVRRTSPNTDVKTVRTTQSTDTVCSTVSMKKQTSSDQLITRTDIIISNFDRESPERASTSPTRHTPSPTKDVPRQQSPQKKSPEKQNLPQNIKPNEKITSKVCAIDSKKTVTTKTNLKTVSDKKYEPTRTILTTQKYDIFKNDKSQTTKKNVTSAVTTKKTTKTTTDKFTTIASKFDKDNKKCVSEITSDDEVEVTKPKPKSAEPKAKQPESTKTRSNTTSAKLTITNSDSKITRAASDVTVKTTKTSPTRMRSKPEINVSKVNTTRPASSVATTIHKTTNITANKTSTPKASPKAQITRKPFNTKPKTSYNGHRIDEDVVVDIQQAKSSRENSPDRICPMPLRPNEDTGKPRFPDRVTEPEDYVPKKKTHHQTIHESELLTDLSERIIELSDDEIELHPRRRISDNDRVNGSDECLLSVSDKVSRFANVSDTRIEDRGRHTVVKDFLKQEIDSNLENDECLLSVNDKVSRFLSTAEKITEPIRLTDPAPKKERPDLSNVGDDLRTDECLLSVTDKVTKFVNTAEKVSSEKSPGLVSKASKMINDVKNKFEHFETTQHDVSLNVQKETVASHAKKTSFENKHVKQASPERTVPKSTPHSTPERTSPNTHLTPEKVTPKRQQTPERVAPKSQTVPEKVSGKPHSTPEKTLTKPQVTPEKSPINTRPITTLRSCEAVKKAKALFENIASQNPDAQPSDTPYRKTTKLTDIGVYKKSPTAESIPDVIPKKDVDVSSVDSESEVEVEKPGKVPFSNGTYEKPKKHPKADLDTPVKKDITVNYMKQAIDKQKKDSFHLFDKQERVVKNTETTNVSKQTDAKTSEYTTADVISTRRGSGKFGVELRRTSIDQAFNSERRRSSVEDSQLQATIEEIFDLAKLEQLLEITTGYEQRRRIRSQMRIVRINLENTGRTDRTCDKTESSQQTTKTQRTSVSTTQQETKSVSEFRRSSHSENESISMDCGRRHSKESHTTTDKKRSTNTNTQQETYHSRSTSPEKRSPERRRESPGKMVPTTESAARRRESPQKITSNGTAGRRRESPEKITTNGRPGRRSPEKRYQATTESVRSSQTTVKENGHRTSSPETKNRKSSPDKFGTCPKVRNSKVSEYTTAYLRKIGVSNNLKPEAIPKIVNVKKEKEEKIESEYQSTYSRKTSSSTERVEKSSYSSKNNSRSGTRSPSPAKRSPSPTEKLYRRSPSPDWKRPREEETTDSKTEYQSAFSNFKSKPSAKDVFNTLTRKKEEAKPEWATTNILRKTSETRSFTSKKVEGKKTVKRSQSPSKVVKKPLDVITSSYGVGPTDDNGRPMFGLKALRKHSGSNQNYEVKGTIVREEFHVQNGGTPVGRVTVTAYSSDPADIAPLAAGPGGGCVATATTRGGTGVTSVTKTKRYGAAGNSISKIYKQPNQPKAIEGIPQLEHPRVVRQGSVKTLTEKFIKNAVETVKTEKPSYPKAGLILRSNSLKDASEGVSSRSTSPGLARSDSERSVGSSQESETRMEFSSSQHRSSGTTTTTTSSSSFLGSNTKVSGVQDIICRMKNADIVVEDGDTSEDAEARALLNKFLGATVLMAGMEGHMSNKQQRQGSHYKQESKTVVSKSSKVSQDIDDIWDERILKRLLEESSDYEERRRIRARLRQVMAEQEACAQIVAAAAEEGGAAEPSVKEEITTTVETTTTTEKVTNVPSKILGDAPKAKPVSPFAKFRQLDKQNSTQSAPRM